MKVELEAGSRPPLRVRAPAPAAEPSWQGSSVAEWQVHAGAAAQWELKVVTTGLRPATCGKRRALQCPHVMTEYYHGWRHRTAIPGYHRDRGDRRGEPREPFVRARTSRSCPPAPRSSLSPATPLDLN